MDGGAWRATVHGAAKSRTRLSDFTFTFLKANSFTEPGGLGQSKDRVVGRISVQKGLSLILLEHVSLSVAYL